MCQPIETKPFKIMNVHNNLVPEKTYARVILFNVFCVAQPVTTTREQLWTLKWIVWVSKNFLCVISGLSFAVKMWSKVKVKFALKQATKGLYSFFNLGASWSRWSTPQPRSLYPPGMRTCILCIGGWVGPRAGLDGCRKLAFFGVRSPYSPAHKKSPYRPSYPGPPS